MGVRGLTTYIERNKNEYLKRHYLRDTYLVIDGNSLCAQLYQHYSKCNDVFGGDYDKFAKCIETFFSLLQQCNVTPIVIFDGGYERKKIKTCKSRLQNKLKLIQNINPISLGGCTIFPLFLREAFKDTLIKLNILLMRCDFEADLEIACAAKQLCCPVLSYDSDFYIFDALYIPFPTLDFHVTKMIDRNGSKYAISCSIYNIEIFLQHHHMQKDCLPLMATLLGNDYVKRSMFTKFYNHLKLPKSNGTRSYQYRTIMGLITWLKTETFRTALHKILSRVKRHQRIKLTQQIMRVTNGYFGRESEVIEYLNLPRKNTTEVTNEVNNVTVEIEEVVSEDDDEGNAPFDSESDDSVTDIDDQMKNYNSDKIIQSKYFKNNIRNGNFPSLLIDLISLNLIIYTPQVEDLMTLNTFNIYLPIVQVISKILLGNTKYFRCLGRSENSNIKMLQLKPVNFDLPNINEIELLNELDRKSILIKAMSLPPEILKTIAELPDEWHIYFMSLIYWSRNRTNSKLVSYYHINSIILCLLHINIVDTVVPNFRKKTIFNKKYGTRLKTILEVRKNDKTSLKEVNLKLNDSIKKENVTIEDCLFYIDSFVAHFEYDDKVKNNKNLFSIQVIDDFAQFQTCLLHIKYLNALLNFPLKNFDICLFYNGTYIYNLYSNLYKRTNMNDYIDQLLKKSPNLYLIYKQIITILGPILSTTACITVNKKARSRRKRNKKNAIDATETNEDCNEKLSSSEEDSTIFDKNNKFSLLAVKNV